MTLKQVVTLRNFMIILCILMCGLLGEKVWKITDKIKMVQEGDRLYAAGDFIAAEGQYRAAAANPSILYREDRIAERLTELSPVSAIRGGLDTLILSAKAQAANRDFTGFLKSYETLLSLKDTYMKPGTASETYYRQLSAASGISEQFTACFQQFKQQFLAELAESQAGGGTGGGNVSNRDSFKWNLMLIPEAYYGGAASKEKALAARFEAHDRARLKALAAAGSFAPLLENTLSMSKAYASHDYEAAWVQQQADSSVKSILNKDLDGSNITAFAGHAAAYRQYAGSAGLAASKILTLIDNRTTKLLQSAERLSRKNQYAEAIQLYGELAPLQDNSAAIAAAHLAWNIADPVRLLPGGGEPGKYGNVISATGQYGTKVLVAGTDTSGRLYYAAVNTDDSIVTLSGDSLPGFSSLRSLAWDEPLGALSGVPVVLAQAVNADGRISFTAYEMQPQGIAALFSFAGNSYQLQPDESIMVSNADIGDGASGQTALYRKVDGIYQFAELVQEYPVVAASELENHPFEKLSLGCVISLDSSGRTVAYADGRYIALQGEVGSVTGNALVSGQFQNGYDFVDTDMGEQYVPVFMVDSVGSMSSSY